MWQLLAILNFDRGRLADMEVESCSLEQDLLVDLVQVLIEILIPWCVGVIITLLLLEGYSWNLPFLFFFVDNTSWLTLFAKRFDDSHFEFESTSKA